MDYKVDAKDWRYQISKTDGKGGIYVVRSDSIEEVKKDIDTIMGGNTEKVVSQSPVVTQTPMEKIREQVKNSKSWCNIHGVSMKQRVGKDEKVFYSHARQTNGDWEYCNGVSGFASEKREAIEEAYKG